MMLTIVPFFEPMQGPVHLAEAPPLYCGTLESISASVRALIKPVRIRRLKSISVKRDLSNTVLMGYERYILELAPIRNAWICQFIFTLDWPKHMTRSLVPDAWSETYRKSDYEMNLISIFTMV